MWHIDSGDTFSWRAAPPLTTSACPPPAGPVQQQHNKDNVTVLYFETREQLAAQEQRPRDETLPLKRSSLAKSTSPLSLLTSASLSCSWERPLLLALSDCSY
jgi:hypothetical protein